MGKRGTKSAKEILKQLQADGWKIKRKGPGDHVQLFHPDKLGRVTLDMGAHDIPIGTLRSVYRQAGWEW